jgi:hypothetical protein
VTAGENQVLQQAIDRAAAMRYRPEGMRLVGPLAEIILGEGGTFVRTTVAELVIRLAERGIWVSERRLRDWLQRFARDRIFRWLPFRGKLSQLRVVPIATGAKEAAQAAYLAAAKAAYWGRAKSVRMLRARKLALLRARPKTLRQAQPDQSRKPKIKNPLVEARFAPPDRRAEHREREQQERLRLQAYWPTRKLAVLLEGWDAKTDVTMARTFLDAEYPVDPGVADYLEAKLLGEPGLTVIPPSAAYVIGILRNLAAGHACLPRSFRIWDDYSSVDEANARYWKEQAA